MGKLGYTISILISSNDSEYFQCIIDLINSQTGLKITGVENDETNTIIKTGRLKPDVLILDLISPVIDETDLAPIIRRRSPDTAIIMMCDRDENEYAGKALRAGISGFLLKKTDMDKLIPVIKIVNMGGFYISASIINRALNSISNPFSWRLSSKLSNNQYKGNLPFLSSLERCIISKIALGFSDKEIAGHINYSAGTVKNCVSAIKRKTKLKTRAEIAVFSLVNGFTGAEHTEFMGEKSDRHIYNYTIE